MRDFLDKTVSLGIGLAIASKEQAEKFVDEMIKKGELNKAESQQYVDELLKKGREAQTVLEEKVRGYMLQAVHEMHLVTREDYLSLKQRVSELEQRVAELESEVKAPQEFPAPESLPPAES